MKRTVVVSAAVLVVAPWVSAADIGSLNIHPQSFHTDLYSGSATNHSVNLSWSGDAPVIATVTTNVSANHTNTTGLTTTATPTRLILHGSDTRRVNISIKTHPGLVPDTFTVNISANTSVPVKTQTETVTSVDTEVETIVKNQTVETVQWRNTTEIQWRNTTTIRWRNTSKDVNETQNQAQVAVLQANISELQDTIREQEEVIERLRNQTKVAAVTKTITETATRTITQTVTKIIPVPVQQLAQLLPGL